MSIIEEAKTYTGKDLETIFFRPMMTGPTALDLGIRMLYNMPVPTTLQFWRRSGDILQKYTSAGWVGSIPADKYQKTIEMHKVKAEVGYSAADYFSLVYELITGRADVNMDDLTGTELEQAETQLFRQAISESIRATMWLGDTTRKSGKFATFDGFLKSIFAEASIPVMEYNESFLTATEESVRAILVETWDQSSEYLKALKGEGNLVYFVSSDLYARYQTYLEDFNTEGAYTLMQRGHDGPLTFRGIPIVDVRLKGYIEQTPDLKDSFAILTDRRNLAMAVNTNDFPGTEIRMWYNPDQMENRQRAIFMAGCDYLMPELISTAIKVA